jgi:hypothetical protein
MKDKKIKKDFKDLFADQIAKIRLTELGLNFIPALKVLIEQKKKRITTEELIVKKGEK